MTFQEWFYNSDYKHYDIQQIRFLDCSNSNLVSLEGIGRLTHLRELYCNGNKLVSLKGIEKVTTLEELYCNNNKLKSLRGIENLIFLEHISYRNNDFQTQDYHEFSTTELRMAVKNNIRKEKIKKIL